ncbi:MAG: hypothetical protein KC586_01830, partial [Myxococcales bacterium]|nr:hypothetical protein [Myxococcales bacterium]
VKEAQRELQRAEERLEEAKRAQEEAERLREALAHATQRRDDAREALAEAERDAEATERKQAAERALEDARRALADYEADAARARALADEVKALDERVSARRTALEAAVKAEREARDAHDAAKATLRDVRGADAEREMRLWELQRAWDDAVVAANRAKAARAKAAEAEEARAKAKQSAAKVEAAAAALAEAERAVEDARLAAEALDVVRARREREERTRRVAALAREAEGLEALTASIAEREAQLATPLAATPTAESLEALRRLASERAVAEAKLAVGLSLALRKLGDATVEASADGTAVDAGGRTLALDAARELRVKIGHEGQPLVELVVTGGAADARDAAEAVAKRWRAEASALGLNPEASPDEALATLASQVEAGVARRREREDSERALVAEREQWVRAKSAKEEHDALMARLEAPPAELPEGLAARVEALRSLDLTEALRDDTKRALENARAEVDARRAAHAQLSSAAQVDAREAELKATDAPDPDEDLDALQARADAAGKLVAEFEAASGQVSRAAEEKVTRAKDALDAAELAVSVARRDVDAGAQERAAAGARLEELQRNLARADGDKLAAEVGAREEALAAAPTPSRLVDAATLREVRDAYADAERATTEARERHLRFLGQVEASEGAVAIERHREAREAFELARAKEHEIEVDFGAWRLLRDALRDAENAEGHHLGEALAPKVAARLADLSKHAEAPARYAGLRLDAHLRTEGVVTSGEAREPKQLSVGTREQIALLLRLAVAEILQLPLVLDDHLTHTDPARARWFRDTLRAAAHDTQILVLTCHPDVYLDDADRPSGERTYLDRAAGLLRAIDATRVVTS